jgi:hypothetical protein
MRVHFARVRERMFVFACAHVNASESLSVWFACICMCSFVVLLHVSTYSLIFAFAGQLSFSASSCELIFCSPNYLAFLCSANGSLFPLLI